MTDGVKKLKCSFVDGEMRVGFGAQEFKERKSLLKGNSSVPPRDCPMKGIICCKIHVKNDRYFTTNDVNVVINDIPRDCPVTRSKSPPSLRVDDDIKSPPPP
jgi:hypothetical protein